MWRSRVVLLATAVLSAAGGAWVGSLRTPPEPPPWHDVLAATRGGPASSELRQVALAALDRAEDPRELAEAIELLGFVGRPGDEPLLDSIVAGRDDALAWPAVAALGRLGTDEAVELLTARLRDRRAPGVAEALGRSGHPRATEALLDALDEPMLQGSAAAGLAASTDPAALDALLQLVEDGGPRVRELAASALASRATDPRVEARARAILDDPRHALRPALLAGLVDARDPLAHDALLRDLARASGPAAVRAAHLLGQLRDARAIPALAASARTGSADMRYASVQALGQIGDPEAVDALVQLAQDGGAAATAAVAVLPDPSEPRALDLLLRLARGGTAELRVTARRRLFDWPWTHVPDEVLAEARRALADPPGRWTSAADPTSLLVEHGEEEDWEALEELASVASPFPNLVSALAGSNRPEARELLVRLAESADPNVRYSVQQALLELGEVDRVEALVLAQLGHVADYGATERLLLQIDTPRATAAVLERVEVGTTTERQGALQAISGMGDREQLARLLALADRTDDGALREQILGTVVNSDGVDLAEVASRARAADPPLDAIAARALERLGTPDASAQLLELMESDQSEARYAALSALTQLGGPDAEAALAEGLHDERLVYVAASGLQALGTPSARSALREAAEGVGVSREVRTAALRSIRWAEEVDGAEVLEQALDDPELEVRTTALSALESIGTTDAARVVARHLDRDDESERRIVAQTLARLGGRVAEEHRAELDALTGDVEVEVVE